jgi:OmpA-OmpF porin, OOP family
MKPTVYSKLIFFSLVPVFCFIHLTVSAQSQWASSVTGYSSVSTGGTKNQYKPEQALGKPNKLPATGSATTAWSPLTDDGGTEYIHVAFKKAQKAQQIAVAENFNPGSITKIEAFDSLGTATVVYENNAPQAIPGLQGRMFNHFFPLTNYAVKSVKITLNTLAVPGSNQIDAIGISASTDSLKALINLVKSSETVEAKVNLGEMVNSATDDLLPVISPNGKTLYFTRQSHPQNIAPVSNQDIWYSAINEKGEFSAAQNIGAPLNNSENSAATSITPDGQRMLVLNVYNPDGTMEKGVSISHYNGTSWGFPQKVIIDSFYNDNIYGEYILSNSGRFLIMTLERNDSEGSKDLYISFVKQDGTWTAPKRMGNLLNSAESETSPFLCADERTLYFSSKGRSGFGSNDMFVTHRLDDTWLNWSEPENLGSEINTPGWDAYFSLPANGEYAYYVSYSNSLGGADIFRQKLPTWAKPTPVALVSGQVLHAKTKVPMRAKITYKNLTNGLVLGEGYSDSLTGKFEIALPSGFKYAIVADKNEFYSVNETVDLTQLKAYKELTKNIYMVPIEVGETARLNNLFFDFNKAVLKPESFVELDQLVQLMNQRPMLEIQISGHTDDVGELQYNIDLSLKRAKAVRDYLISKGIKAERITHKGFGESKPLAQGTSEESRQLNRRVEFLILKK